MQVSEGRPDCPGQQYEGYTMKLKHVVIAVGMALGLTACGGGGGSSSSSSSSYDFKVTAVDGYLKNAIVTATCGSARAKA